MKHAGIDIGSRTIKFVIMEDNEIKEAHIIDSGFDPQANALKLVENSSFSKIMATGYGRHFFEVKFDTPTVTEIKAHAVGVHHELPSARQILDIGGQDSKVISLSIEGKVVKFEMNDKCAAGTGKFLEIMARTLGYDLSQFGEEAIFSEKDIQINNMCTVFAESEVTSLLAKGENVRDIAMGLHTSIAKRAISMLKRLDGEGDIVFTGGVALNPCLIHLLKKYLKQDILVPTKPQLTGAIGAAILAGKHI